MKKHIARLITAFALVIGVGSTVMVAPSVSAIDMFSGGCGGGGGGGAQTPATGGGSGVCGAKGDDAPTLIKNVINILLYLIGIIAVISIIIGGIRYVTSNGDPSGIKGAKDTIMYAVIGLVVAIMAFAIVNFVVTAFK